MFPAIAHHNDQQHSWEQSSTTQKGQHNAKAAGELGDEELGSTGFSLAYVDDVNAVIHHQDVDFFLRRFKVLSEPLGAILNTEKTKIMTSTTGT